jgi:hypothetical protein
MSFRNEFRRKTKNIFTENEMNVPICTRIKPIRLKRDNREFQSGMIVSPDIVLVPSSVNEQQLLSKVGLSINESDKSYLIKTKTGQLKGAISFSTDENGNVFSINYIDVDKDDNNFKQSIARLATSPEGISLQKRQIEVTKDEIREDLVVN